MMLLSSEHSIGNQIIMHFPNAQQVSARWKESDGVHPTKDIIQPSAKWSRAKFQQPQPRRWRTKSCQWHCPPLRKYSALTPLLNINLAPYIGSGQRTQWPKKVATAQNNAYRDHLLWLDSESWPVSFLSLVTSVTSPSEWIARSLLLIDFQSKSSGAINVINTEYSNGLTADATVPYMHGNVCPVEETVTAP